MDNIQEISDKEEDFIDRAVNPRINSVCSLGEELLFDKVEALSAEEVLSWLLLQAVSIIIESKITRCFIIMF